MFDLTTDHLNERFVLDMFDFSVCQYLIRVKGQGKIYLKSWADPDGGRGSGPHPLKNHKNIEFLSNADPDPLKNHNPTKSAFNDGPLWKCHLIGVLLEGRCWLAYGGIWILSPLKLKQTLSNLDPSDKPSWIRACKILV